MPITFPALPTGGPFGWGTQLVVQSSVIGPMPTGTVWDLVVSSDNEGANQLAHVTWPWSNQVQFIGLGITDGHFSSVPQVALAEGSSAFVVVQLVQPGNVVVDSGTQAIKWTGTNAGFTSEIDQGASGGLTTDQAAQLQRTDQNVSLTIPFDNLGLVPLTSGPSFGPVNAFINEWVWGCIVRIANVPDDLVAGTPDGDYWTASLAVVRVYRGSDLWLRVPIHTSSKMVGFFSSDLVAAVAAITPLQWILEMSLQVTFRAGVSGEVFLMHHP